jgi:hypothetical protein
MNKEYSITVDGKNVTFEFKDSLIHAEGDAAGNIDAITTITPHCRKISCWMNYTLKSRARMNIFIFMVVVL